MKRTTLDDFVIKNKLGDYWYLNIENPNIPKLLKNINILEDIETEEFEVYIKIDPFIFRDKPEESLELIPKDTKAFLGSYLGTIYSIEKDAENLWRLTYFNTIFYVNLLDFCPYIKIWDGESEHIMKGLPPVLLSKVMQTPMVFPEFIRYYVEEDRKRHY